MSPARSLKLPFGVDFNLEDVKKAKETWDRLSAILKVLTSQFPTYGGTVPYDNGDNNELEYYVYHIYTITKDPERNFKTSLALDKGTDNVKTKLPKSQIDYKTYKNGTNNIGVISVLICGFNNVANPICFTFLTLIIYK